MQLFDKCLDGKHRSRYTITGSTVLKFCKSPFTVWCDLFAPAEAKDPENPYLQRLFEQGQKHEQAVVDTRYPQATEVSLTSFEDGFKQVLQECKKGAETILQTPLFYLKDDMFGIADVLTKSSAHKSIFGDYHYTIREIKSAKRIKNEYIMQAAFYNYILGKIQGYTPPKFFLINRENEEFEYAYEDFEEELMLCLQGIREIQEGKEITPMAKSARWPWESYANKRAVTENDISIVSSVGPALKAKLQEVGITTLSDLVEKPIDLDITDAAKQKLKNHAKAWLEQKTITISKPTLPDSDVELYLDFEGTDDMSTEGMEKTTYLIGLLIKEPSGTHYRPFTAETLAGESAMFHEFLAYLKKYPSAPIYHYGSYEKTNLRQLGAKCKVDVQDIASRLVDLLPKVRKCVALPTISMSLKEVAGFLGFEWQGMADAQESIVLYLQFLDTQERELLQRIIQYNEDDCRATLVVKEFLASL